MCCSTKEGVFTWISALLVNIAFLSLIGWGANEYWPVGMGLTGIYTMILLAIATKIDAKQRPTASGTVGLANDEEEEEEEEEGDENHSRIEKVIMDDDLDLSIASAKREDVSSLVNLLYFLSVISLGVTGFFLVVNLIPECKTNYNSNSARTPKFTWEPDFDTIPFSVRDWATSENHWRNNPNVDHGGSFGYVRSTGITLFQGSSNDAFAAGLVDSPTSTSSMYQDIDKKAYLWKVGNSSPPALVQGGFAYPGPMVTVTDDAVCFSAVPVAKSNNKSDLGLRTVYCSNGIEFKEETMNVTTDNELSFHHGRLTSFYPVDRILWFKDVDYGYVSGTKLFSLDPVTMISTLHSYKVQESPSSSAAPIVDTDTSCNQAHMDRLAAIIALFVSVLPMASMTFVLGKKTKVPSMGVSAYLCITLVYICLHFVVSPEDREGDYRVWFAISGLACLLFSTYSLLTLRQQDSNSPRWIDKSHERQFRSLLGISAVAFSWGVVAVIVADIYSERETFGMWFLCNLLVCCPLLLLGAAADSTFVLALGGLGFLADAARLASLIDSVLFFFLVFSLMGLMVGFLGYYFAVQYQPIIQKWASEQVALVNEKYCSNAFDPYHGLEVYEYGDEDTDPLATGAADPTVYVI